MNELLTVYTVPGNALTCLTTEALDKAGLSYLLVDLSLDPTAVDRVLALGHTTLPIVTIGAASWTGHRPDKIHAVAAAHTTDLYLVPTDPMGTLTCDSCQ